MDTGLTAESVEVGESVVISADVSNPTGQQAQGLVTLSVDGRLVATKGVSLDPGETKTLTFQRTFEEPGSHEVTVLETPLTSIFVMEPTETDGSSTAVPTASGSTTPNESLDSTADTVDVVEAQGLADWIRAGYNASVRVTLANQADTAARYTMQVTIDGDPVANKTVMVPANGETTASIEFPARSGTVRVGETEVGSLTVSESFQAAADRTEATTSGDGTGFGFGTVAIVVLATVIAVRAPKPDRRDD